MDLRRCKIINLGNLLVEIIQILYYNEKRFNTVKDYSSDVTGDSIWEKVLEQKRLVNCLKRF